MLIVGIDFSATAARALAEARALAAELGEQLQPVHVREPYLTAPWVADRNERDWLGAFGLGSEEVEVRLGTPWVELVRIAGERRARLIVVGTHGHTGFQPLALGSTASRLSLLAPLPILLVGARERFPGENGSANHTTPDHQGGER